MMQARAADIRRSSSTGASSAFCTSPSCWNSAVDHSARILPRSMIQGRDDITAHVIDPDRRWTGRTMPSRFRSAPLTTPCSAPSGGDHSTLDRARP